MGPSLPVGLRIDIARSEIARVIQPEDQDYCLELLQAAFASYLEAVRNKADENRRHLRGD
jgi:hypothetical protein